MRLDKINNKDVRHLAKRFARAGCDLSFTGSGHVAVRKSGRLVVVLPSSPSDHRALMNVEREARRRGVRI
jgi:hypothetical protein